MVRFDGVWCEGVVIQDQRGHVLCHVDRPPNFGSRWIRSAVPDRAIIAAKTVDVKHADT